MKRPILVHYIAVALPVGVSLESSGLMDALSDLRDDSDGRIVEWAHAPNPETGEREGVVKDGESDEMLELFESSYVSPGRFEEEGR